VENKDLTSIAEARALARTAKQAQPRLAELSQEQIDQIVAAMAGAVTPHAEALARLAVDETGFGVVEDKIQKNLFGSKQVYEFIRPMRTVGVIGRVEDKKVVEIAEPFGVVAAIVPSTNPTSTAIYKVLIALKARCPIVISPHPSATRCITRTVELMAEAADRAGVPVGSIGWMKTVTLEGTQELMKAREVAVILATGGMGLVRAAYSAGKPAYGVGPGNAPCYIERSADLRQRIALLLAEFRRCGRVDRGRSAAPVPVARRLFHERRGNRRPRKGARDCAAPAEPVSCRPTGLGRRGESRPESSRGDEGVDCAAQGRRP
jgi:acetaldehyde dehydrogenase (acetylating)